MSLCYKYTYYSGTPYRSLYAHNTDSSEFAGSIFVTIASIQYLLMKSPNGLAIAILSRPRGILDGLWVWSTHKLPQEQLYLSQENTQKNIHYLVYNANSARWLPYTMPSTVLSRIECSLLQRVVCDCELFKYAIAGLCAFAKVLHEYIAALAASFQGRLGHWSSTKKRMFLSGPVTVGVFRLIRDISVKLGYKKITLPANMPIHIYL